MDTAIKFLYLSEPDMIRAGVTDMDACVEAMEDLLLTLHKGDYVMGGKNHNSHGCMVTFPDDRNLMECRKMQRTDVSWRCRHILADAIRWRG